MITYGYYKFDKFNFSNFMQLGKCWSCLIRILCCTKNHSVCFSTCPTPARRFEPGNLEDVPGRDMSRYVEICFLIVNLCLEGFPFSNLWSKSGLYAVDCCSFRISFRALLLQVSKVPHVILTLSVNNRFSVPKFELWANLQSQHSAVAQNLTSAPN
jgi:hypothetical protein